MNNLILTFRHWYETLEIVHESRPTNSIFDSITISTMGLLPTSYYKIEMVTKKHTKLHIFTVPFYFSGDLLFKLSKNTLEKYIITGLQQQINRLLKNNKWKTLYITDLYTPIFMERIIYITSTKLRKLLMMGPKNKNIDIKSYAILYLGGR